MYITKVGTASQKRWSLLLMVMLLSVLVVGCSMAGENDKNNNSVNENSGENDQELSEISLYLYFVKYTADDAYLVREERVISGTDQVAKAAVEALINDEKSIFPAGTKVLGVTIDNGLATIDFNQKVLAANVGSSGEALGIQSVVNTLTEFPSIEKVSFQVEGSSEGTARDWWGHVGLYEQPFTRDVSRVYEPAIWVTHPSPNQVVGIPLLIKGSARVPEGEVTIRLLDNTGTILAESSATNSKEALQRGEFEASLKFDPPSEGRGTLEIFPGGGSDEDKVTVSVQWP